MKLKAFSLLETVVALSILAFVTAASLYHVGNLLSRSQIDMGRVYLLVKAVENTPLSEEARVETEAFVVGRTLSKYSGSLDIVSVEARHKNGRAILVTRKLVRHVE